MLVPCYLYFNFSCTVCICRCQCLHTSLAIAQLHQYTHIKWVKVESQYIVFPGGTFYSRSVLLLISLQTPKDKLKCVLRCSQTIMNLLSMANEKTVPAADDFMPVLIFVLIKANPPCLLSTIQYVESFYVNRLQGEEQYWWLQFSSAVEFIKTMDYSE